jgi:hypothetical protein
MAWKERWNEAIVGAGLGALAMLMLLAAAFGPELAKGRQAENDALARARADFAQAERLLQTCQAREAELTSTGTILFEWERGKGLELFEGLVEIQPGTMLGGQYASGQSRPRWAIKYRVTPVVYGDGQGTAYAWVNVKTKTVEGPFAPEVSR